MIPKPVIFDICDSTMRLFRWHVKLRRKDFQTSIYLANCFPKPGQSTGNSISSMMFDFLLPWPTIWSFLSRGDLLMADYLPLTWARIHHWVALLSDQNLDLYDTTDWLVSILPFYILIFLFRLSVHFPHRGFPESTGRLVIVIEKHLEGCSWVFFATWLLTACPYAWSQPGIAACVLAWVDLCVEQALISLLTDMLAWVVTALIDWSFPWHHVVPTNPVEE